MISGIHFHVLFPAFNAFFFGLGFPHWFHIALLAVVAPPVLPSELAILLPPAIAGLSRYLRGSGLPRWLNIILAIVSLVAIAVFCAWLTNGFTDFKQSTLVVLGFVTLISGGAEMVSLFNYLETSPSPLLAVIPPTSQTAPVPVPVIVVSSRDLAPVPSHAAITEPQPIILSAQPATGLGTSNPPLTAPIAEQPTTLP